MFITKSAAEFGSSYAARSDLPRRGIILNMALSFAIQHSLLLSKLPSITRFSLQPFTSHWCTKKITSHFFSFGGAFTANDYFQNTSSLPLTGWHTLYKPILTNLFSNERIMVQRTHHIY